MPVHALILAAAILLSLLSTPQAGADSSNPFLRNMNWIASNQAANWRDRFVNLVAHELPGRELSGIQLLAAFDTFKAHAQYLTETQARGLNPRPNVIWVRATPNTGIPELMRLMKWAAPHIGGITRTGPPQFVFDGRFMHTIPGPEYKLYYAQTTLVLGPLPEDGTDISEAIRQLIDSQKAEGAIVVVDEVGAFDYALKAIGGTRGMKIVDARVDAECVNLLAK